MKEYIWGVQVVFNLQVDEKGNKTLLHEGEPVAQLIEDNMHVCPGLKKIFDKLQQVADGIGR